MKAYGMFFLTRPPFRVRITPPRNGHDHGWQLPLGERASQRGIQMLNLIWIGPAADAFMQAHPDLKAGDCLNLHIDRPHLVQNEPAGFVERAELAPPRWASHADDAEPASAIPQPPRVVSCCAPPISLAPSPMSHSIVSLATVRLHAQAAVRDRRSVEDACPYPFDSAAGGAFKAYYEAEVQRERAEQTQATQPEGQPS